MSNKRIYIETFLVGLALVTYLIGGLYLIGWYNHAVKLALGVIK